jgi:putative SOS response-associated peptidase YedK
MCGRYRRRSDKQRIAEAFQANVGLEELSPDPGDDIAPGSIQPVVLICQGRTPSCSGRDGFRAHKAVGV